MESELRNIFKELDWKLEQIHKELQKLFREVRKVAISQEQFDTDLAAFVSAVQQLITAVQALPQTDLTAEDQEVQDAAANVQTELGALTPAPAPEPTTNP